MKKTEKSDTQVSQTYSEDTFDGKCKVTKYGYRHQQCLIMLICLTTAYSMRACIGVALVGMMENNDDTVVINSTEINNTIEIGISLPCQEINSKAERLITSESESRGGILPAMLLVPPYPKFKWSEKIQGAVMSSFFWGYMLLQIPAGQLVHKFGPRRLLVGALAINSVVSICFPWAVHYGGWICAMVCRMIQGLSQACIIPGMYAFFGRWAPLEERSRLVGFAHGGQALGIVLGLPITGFIAASSLGWPGVFRFYGLLSGLVASLVFFMVYDTPALHPKLTISERRHIEGRLRLEEGKEKKKTRVPWRDILQCRALYILALSHISQTWGLITLFTEIPVFMNKVMLVDIKSNGLLTALPFAVMWVTNFFFSWFTDWIIVKKYMSLTNARKVANSLGCVPAAIGLVVLAYVPKDIVIVESILVFICAFKVAAHSGSMVTHVDIAPNFAGTMMSITNFCSNLIGSQAPLVVAFLVSDESNEDQWRNVFFVAAGLYFFVNLIYCFFGSAEEAIWNNPIKDDDPEVPELKPMIDELTGTSSLMILLKNERLK